MAFAYSKRGRGNFDPGDKRPHRISRSKIDLFVECPRCFYLDQRLGIKRPDSPPFSLNNAVDLLLKKEFDVHRKNKSAHPLMVHHHIDAVPFDHRDLEVWRDALRSGIEYLHSPTNLSVRGGVDDVWVNSSGELIIVDYKATSKTSEINLDAEWQDGYKRQMEVYQWLFEKNGFAVSKTGYFVYVNARQDREGFDERLDFETHLLPYTGNSAWIEPVIFKIKECLVGDLPSPDEVCAFCAYRKFAAEAAVNGNSASKKTSKVKEKNEKNRSQESLQSNIFG